MDHALLGSILRLSQKKQGVSIESVSQSSIGSAAIRAALPDAKYDVATRKLVLSRFGVQLQIRFMPYDGLLLPRHPAVFVGGEDLDQREYRRGVSSLIAAYRKAIGCKFEPEFEGRPISSRNVEDLWS